MKILRHKNLFGLIYAVMLAIPMVAVLSKVIYVQSNKNAYQSYYGETINEEEYVSVDSANLEINRNYVYINNAFTYQPNADGQSNYDLYVTDVIGNGQSYNANILRFQTTASVNYLFLYNNSTYVKEYNLNTTGLELSFTFERYNTNANNDIYNHYYLIEYNSYSYLDNVFEYAIDQTIEENNFGRIPFVNWLSGMFLDDNQVNNRYIHYTNWYMNYMLFVSTAYILFLVLMWFVNFARRLLERGMNYDF